MAFGGSGRAEGLGFLGSKTRVVTLLAVCLLWASSTSFLHQMGAWGPGRPPGQETLGSQQRTVVEMGLLRSGRGRMEMPCLGRGPWVPFQALLPNLTKVSGVCSAACSPISNLTPHTGLWLAGLSRAAPCSFHLLLMAPALWPTGILKKKCLPTISEKSSLLRLPLEQGTGSSRGSSASEGSRGGPPPRPPPRQSLQEQLNGVMPIAMSIKAGTVDEDSSGSE